MQYHLNSSMTPQDTYTLKQLLVLIHYTSNDVGGQSFTTLDFTLHSNSWSKMQIS